MPADDPVIRDLADEDVARLAEIAVDAWEPIYEGYRGILGGSLFEAKYGDWREHKAAQIETHCHEHPDTVWVATLDGTVVGFVTVRVDRDAGIVTIGNNAVDPDFQRRGIATRFYRQVLGEFSDRGFSYAERTPVPSAGYYS